MGREKKVFVPLTLGLIEEGVFLEDINKELMAAQKKLLDFAQTYGKQAIKAKAEITAKVSLICSDVDNEMYAIKTSISMKLPGRPGNVTVAMAATGEDGEACLHVRKSGSDEGNPRQMKLATRSGRTIVPETGEVEDE